MTNICYYTRIHTAKRLLLALLTLLAVCVLTVSCNRDEVDNPDTGKVRIKFFAGATPSKQATPETEVTQAQAFVFIYNGSEYLYDYRVPSTAITDIGNNATTFNLLVATETRPAKLYIVANANDAITANEPQAGDTESAVRQRIVENFTASGMSSNFPMWGEYEFPTGISASLNNTIVNLNVLRAIARIDITADQVGSVFSMVSIQAFRANNLMQVAPDSYSGSLLVTQPSIPASATQTANTTPISASDNLSVAQLYLPEAAAPAAENILLQACCVVVGGRYNGSSTVTYYRIDFQPDIEGYPTGQILRNHHYTFNVTDVTQPGFPSPEAAANNNPIGMAVLVNDWTLKNMDVNTGGNERFIISSRTIYVSGLAGSYGYVSVSSSVTDFVIQFADDQLNPVGNHSTSIQNDLFSALIFNNRNYILVQALTDNPNGTGQIVQNMLIIAGRSRIPVRIIQTEQ